MARGFGRLLGGDTLGMMIRLPLSMPCGSSKTCGS
jgi:hypothetical protein